MDVYRWRELGCQVGVPMVTAVTRPAQHRHAHHYLIVMVTMWCPGVCLQAGHTWYRIIMTILASQGRSYNVSQSHGFTGPVLQCLPESWLPMDQSSSVSRSPSFPGSVLQCLSESWLPRDQSSSVSRSPGFPGTSPPVSLGVLASQGPVLQCLPES